MKVFDFKKYLAGSKIEDCILIHFFEEYKENGGALNMLDAYAKMKERAKSAEGKYIDATDQFLSGIPVDDDTLRYLYKNAQVGWYLLHLWFNKPLREVDYNTFDLNEFNKL